MNTPTIKDVLSEINDFYGEGHSLEAEEVMGLMQIARLDRIAVAMEGINQSLEVLAGCVGIGGSFCIAGDVITSED